MLLIGLAGGVAAVLGVVALFTLGAIAPKWLAAAIFFSGVFGFGALVAISSSAGED